MVTEERDEQLAKAVALMVTRESGRITVVRAQQYSKAFLEM